MTSVVLDDFNGDGFIDVATSNGGDNTISVLRNNGTGVFTEVSRLSPGPMLGIRSVGDLNGDARPDIVFGRIVTGGAVVSLYFNSATARSPARWTSGQSRPSCTTAQPPT